MFQDIAPDVYDNCYHNIQPAEEDYIVIFKNNSVFLRKEDDLTYALPQKKDLPDVEYIYLFSVSESRYFLDLNEYTPSLDGFQFEPDRIIRTVKPKTLCFVLAAARSLYQFYTQHRYCPACKTNLLRDDRERMLKCPNCQMMIYPTISPAVIVGIVNKDKILMSRYQGRAYKHYALIAGFNEIGETIEETVIREVREEVGLNVRNITYYKSQPWTFTNSLLMGFFCELDGDDRITLQEDELSEAGWFTAEEIPPAEDEISLTNEMKEIFRTGRIRDFLPIKQ